MPLNRRICSDGSCKCLGWGVAMWLAVKISLVLFMLGFMITGECMDKSRKD